jgi:LAO/AO transport system kinase
VFIRSLAARDRLGGLADTARAALAILSAAFDRVFVETVGVGQSEVEVAALTDTLVYLVNPGTGDTLQFMKAGILELPDIFAVSKADLGPEASRAAGELASGLGLGERADAGWTPPVLLTSARDGTGIDELVETLDAHRRALLEGDRLRERRRRGREAFVLGSLELRYGSYGLEKLGGRRALLARIRENQTTSSFALVAEIGRELEGALRAPA